MEDTSLITKDSKCYQDMKADLLYVKSMTSAWQKFICAKDLALYYMNTPKETVEKYRELLIEEGIFKE